jgi:hypothetical protein
VSELRWILLGLGLLLIGGIWWRGARGARQASGDAELRDTPAARGVAAEPAHHSVDAGAALHGGHAEFAAADRDWGVSPFEPLTIKTADFERVPILDEPFVAEPGALAPPAARPTAHGS